MYTENLFGVVFGMLLKDKKEQNKKKTEDNSYVKFNLK